MNQAPLGGVGTSGQGNYHGYFSFKAFSHQRSIASVPRWVEALIKVRYMPYNVSELKRSQRMLSLKPNFDRNGHATKGLKYWIGFLFSLGGKSAQGGLLRWGVLIAFAAIVGLKKGYLGP